MREIRLQAHDILDKHCKRCETHLRIVREKDYYAADDYCLKKCPIGQQLQALGRQLEGNERKQRRWTKEMVKQAVALRKKGMSYSQIEAVLGISKTAISSKLHQLGKAVVR